MQVKIKRIDSSLPLPEYQTIGSVAFDLYSRIDGEISPGEIVMFPTNLIIATPPGYVLMIAPRSSLCRKKGLKLGNTIGVIDQDFCGPEDEILLPLQNFTKQTVSIKRGERLVQAMFVRIDKVSQWQEVDQITESSRGGYGSTAGYEN